MADLTHKDRFIRLLEDMGRPFAVYDPDKQPKPLPLGGSHFIVYTDSAIYCNPDIAFHFSTKDGSYRTGPFDYR